MKSMEEINREIREMQEQHRIEMKQELLRVQRDGEDRGYIYAGEISFDYSKYWFKVKTQDYCRIYSHVFACENIKELKKAICWIVNETKFCEVTAFVKGRSYVTFRSQKDIDLYFEEYYGER